MNLGEMIRNARLSAGMSARELARAVGLSHSYVSQVEMGGITAPSPGVLKRMSVELDSLDYRYLLVAAGYISRADELGDSVEEASNKQHDNRFKNNKLEDAHDYYYEISDKGDLVKPIDSRVAQRIVQAISDEEIESRLRKQKNAAIPIVGSIPAGSSLVAAVAHFEPLDTYQIPESVCGIGPLSVLRVTGDSMKDEGIIDGDIVVIDRGATPRNLDICAVQIEGEHPTLKRIAMSNDYFVLSPANSAYQSIVVRVDDVGRTVTIFGKVIHCCRTY